AVLAGAGLGNDAGLAHPFGQQPLAETVVDLVRAGVAEVLALDPDLRAAELLGKAPRRVEQRRSPDVVRVEVGQLGDEVRIDAPARVGFLELEQSRHQGFGNEASSELAEATSFVGK